MSQFVFINMYFASQTSFSRIFCDLIFLCFKKSTKCKKQGMQFYKLPSQTSHTIVIILSNKLHISKVEETVNLLLRNFWVCTHIHQASGSHTCCYSNSHLCREKNILSQTMIYNKWREFYVHIF